MFFALAFLSLLIERLTGYPDWLFKRIGHPVTWIGSLIALLDKKWNRESASFSQRKASGVLALSVFLALTVLVAWLVQSVLLLLPLGLLLVAVLGASLPAQKSLEQHVEAVAIALEREGIDGGRKAVSMIVGRDPQALDEAAICRAAIESLAENFSDGIVAPSLWLGLLGLPGGAGYKAINTADSMIGHRSPRHEAFGWASARLDDLVNLPASRLSGGLFVVAAFFVKGASPKGAIAAIRRDARHHRSPNAGWPEAALAGALGFALAGPRSYGGQMIDARFMGEGGRATLVAGDIRTALRLARIADFLLIGLFGLLAILIAL
ncbi:MULTISPECIES: adenosylcobinamide-phosphate synthase CbiB [Rhizobium/Agrobacterium group]|uniref:adenosylcobinamide-phosphate synthase CbiB n=1 Tax=Rhizobium/Agrobacterium group TaxID=227290 RepID=UPI0003F1F12A|nr:MULTISPECIES: adenosylcobinamide-phosphate synthase CbiB [Rhizobium/Agrobacterium group]AHK02666.1 adenosylcobinamide-phosphate synthase [Agrobacterium tumefaciens LBA4213 (Ach5)]NIB57425.1 cobalamin biosynthesis protein CobD [Agrobacterium tumefaciens]NSY70184.1 cobalamin biosynthesis protein CobD [Agrobacterium tumefaciens]NSZ22903.1 cobalamin biosynthesis protein CobD [Agrobacterium tumefaciens]NSZ67252.1 cobalamin biosynthesis protein CobD [Agrobacterium tumefaciens]